MVLGEPASYTVALWPSRNTRQLEQANRHITINWTGKNCFSIDGVNFRARDLGFGDEPSTMDEFIFQKPVWMARRYAALLKKLKPRTIFELGIWRGGSCVFFQRLSQAEKLVAVELSEERVPALDDYIRANNLGNFLIPYYGVNQADKPRLAEILATEFGERQLDLVIDDASHFLDESRDSFNVLFPHMRPGGAYIIEDWSWAHDAADKPDDTATFYPDREPLTKLIFELVLACPSVPRMIENIEIDRNSVTIWRGDKDIDSRNFDISRCYLARGRDLIR